MLTAKEQKIVLSTLTKRRAWLRKTLEDTSLDEKVKTEHMDSLQLLESALQKLSAMPVASSKPAPAKTPAKGGSQERDKPINYNNARILIAEDNDDSAKLLVEILQDIGFKLVDLAVDGKEAFDKIKSAAEPYDLILCDWDMPELTGLQVHEKAKASNTLKYAHFVMVTAVSESARIREAIQQGVNDYIVKPIDVDVLEGKIIKALGLKEEDKPED